MSAWPAPEEVSLDGWILRFADGYTRRSNSVNPIGPVTGDVLQKIRRCRELFRERGLRTIFKITPCVDPPDLDWILESEGFEREAPALVQTLRLAPMGPAPVDEDLELSETPGPRWTELFSRWQGVPLARRAAHHAILEAIRPPRRFAILSDSRRPVACGLAVRESPLVGLFDLVTDPTERGKGYGIRLVRGLLSWGWHEGADLAYLQVMETNEPAIRLYRRLGFEDAYRYWYRVS